MYMGTWICPRDAGQTVERRKGRAKAQLVLCQRVSMRWQVGRGQCQGGGYSQRASHGRLGAFPPKDVINKMNLARSLW